MYSTNFYYPAPFSVDESGFYVVSGSGEKVFNILSTDKNFIDDIISKLNGACDTVFAGKFTHSEDDGTIIRFNGNPVLLVRGWRMLTNPEKFNVRPMEARSIIGAFITETIEKLQINNVSVCQERKKKNTISRKKQCNSSKKAQK